MLGIIFLILKVIGCILLFLIFLLLLILFAPVTYRAKGKWLQEEKMAAGTVSWACFVIRAKVSYVKDNLDFMIRIFGIPVYASDENRWSILGRKKKPKKVKVKKSKKKKEKKVSQKPAVKEEEKKNSQDVLDLEISEEEYKKAITPLADYKRKQEKEETKSRESSRWKKIVDGVQRCYNKIKSICRKVSMVKNKVISIKELFEDDEIQDALRRLWGYGTHILKITMPSKLKGWLHFGMSNPASTGQILGVFGALLPFYGDKVQISPDFEEEVLEGEGRLVGRLFLIQYVILAVKIYLDKDLFEQKDRVMDTIGG